MRSNGEIKNELIGLIQSYKSEHENPVVDGNMRHIIRQQMFELCDELKMPEPEKKKAWWLLKRRA